MNLLDRLYHLDEQNKLGVLLYSSVAQLLNITEDDLRNRVISYLTHNKTQIADFINIAIGQTVEQYIGSIQNKSDWVSRSEAEVIMRMLNRPILLLSGDGKCTNSEDFFRFDGEPLFILDIDRIHSSPMKFTDTTLTARENFAAYLLDDPEYQEKQKKRIGADNNSLLAQEYEPELKPTQHIEIIFNILNADSIGEEGLKLLDVMLEDNLAFEREQLDAYEQHMGELRMGSYLHAFHAMFLEEQNRVLEKDRLSKIPFMPDELRSSITDWAEAAISEMVNDARDDIKRMSGFWKEGHRFSIIDNQKFLGFFEALLERESRVIIHDNIFRLGSRHEISPFTAVARQTISKLRQSSEDITNTLEAYGLANDDKMSGFRRTISEADQRKEQLLRGLLNEHAGTLPVQYQTAIGNEKLVKEIIGLNMSPNVCHPETGVPLLMIALQKNLEDVFKLLLRHYASPFICDKEGKSVFSEMTLELKRNPTNEQLQNRIVFLMDAIKEWSLNRLIPSEFIDSDDMNVGQVFIKFREAKSALDSYGDSFRSTLRMKWWERCLKGYFHVETRLKDWEKLYQGYLDSITTGDFQSFKIYAQRCANETTRQRGTLHTSIGSSVNGVALDLPQFSKKRDDILTVRARRDFMARASELKGQVYMAKHELQLMRARLGETEQQVDFYRSSYENERKVNTHLRQHHAEVEAMLERNISELRIGAAEANQRAAEANQRAAEANQRAAEAEQRAAEADRRNDELSKKFEILLNMRSNQSSTACHPLAEQEAQNGASEKKEGSATSRLTLF